MKVNSENAKRQKICFGNTFGWRPLWSNRHGFGGWRGKMVVLVFADYERSVVKGGRNDFV